MTELNQLSFDFIGCLPGSIGDLPSINNVEKWRYAEKTMSSDDGRFPTETIKVSRDAEITLREISGGIWLWGCRYYNRKRQSGEAFAPFRKWGPTRAAPSRADAITSALLFVGEKMEGSA